MKLYYITFRSVTFAQQGEAVLQRKGIHGSLQRTPKWMEQKGCGYCLRLRVPDIGAALQALRMSRVPLQKVYVQTEQGRLEEWSV